MSSGAGEEERHWGAGGGCVCEEELSSTQTWSAWGVDSGAKGERMGRFSVVGWAVEEAWVRDTKAPSGKVCAARDRAPNLAPKCGVPGPGAQRRVGALSIQNEEGTSLPDFSSVKSSPLRSAGLRRVR